MTDVQGGQVSDEEIVRWFSDPAARDDPHPFFDRLREQDPVHFCEPLNTWVVTSYRHGAQVLKSPHAVRSPTVSSDTSYMYGDDGELRPTWLLDRGTQRWHDGKDLARLRRLVQQVMNPRAIRSWQEQMEQALARAVERVQDRKQMDLVEDFAYELPMHMICEVFGVPRADHDKYRDWTEDWFAAVVFATDPDIQERGDRAAEQFRAHIEDLVRFRRDRPDGSLLSLLIQARDQGDRLSDEELVAMTASMIGAGHSTTGSLVGNAALALLRNPAEMAALRSNPELAGDAVEEALRYEGPSVMTPRYAHEDFDIDGRRVSAGDSLQVILQATGRDPVAYPDPGRFWIERPEKFHLGFSSGPHFCCGAQLARLEARLMLQAITTEFPGLKLDSETVEWKPILRRGLESLPVSWN